MPSSTNSNGPTPEASGKAFLGLISYVKNERSVELLREIIDRGSQEMKTAFSERISVSSWHPYVAYVDFLHQIDRRVGCGDGRICMDLGAEAGRRDLSTVFRIYRALSSPKRLIEGCARVWPSYYKHAGRMEAISALPENTTLRIYDFPEMDPNHCRLMEGWMVATMEALGCHVNDDAHESSCTSKGDPYHEFRCTWSLS